MGWRAGHQGPGRRSGPVRRREVVGWLLAITLGVLLCRWTYSATDFSDKQRYVYGYHKSVPSSSYLAEIRGALPADVLFTIGYTLVLGVCAIAATRLAVSRMSQQVGQLAVAAVAIVLGAGLLRNIFLYFGTLVLGGSGSELAKFFSTATSASSVVWTCALIIAGLSVPALWVLLALRGFSLWQCRPRRQGPYWWSPLDQIESANRRTQRTLKVPLERTPVTE